MTSGFQPSRLLSSQRNGLTDSDSQPDLDFMYDKNTINQAAIFIEDAIKYRSIFHKIDDSSLKLYRFFYSKTVQWGIHCTVFLIHILAFFERPSSITSNWSSDLTKVGHRWVAPCGLLQAVELLCLMVLLLEQLLKTHFIGWKRIKTSKWIIAAYIVCMFSISDCLVSVFLQCSNKVRVRRMLRPFFVIQRSTMMKKVWNCLRRTFPDIASVLLLLLAHLYFFTLFGMLLFPTPRLPGAGAVSNGTGHSLPDNSSISSSGNQTIEDEYFRSFNTSFISLLVLLTTANNPDVMMPAYKENRFSAFYFIVFLMIGLYCLMNMLTAVIYNQFRGYFKASMTSSLFRRRLGIRAAFEMLRNRQLLLERVSVSVQIQSDTGVPKQAVLSTLPKVRISEAARCRVQSALSSFPEYITSDQLQEIFDSYNKKSSADSQVPPIPWLPENTVLFKLQRILVHPMFGYFGCGVVLSNVIAISVLFSTQYDKSLESSHSAIHMMNVCFACYYVLEKMLLMWANGKKRFIKSKAELFDTVILFALVVLEVVFLSRYGSEVFLSTSSSSLDSTHLAWQLVKTINLLIILRLIRLLPQIQRMYLVVISMLDIARNLAPFGGLLLALYYLFAILGMELFEGKIVAPSNTTGESEYSCGTYEQLGYWANNFDDFAAALVVLWNIMVVNNWHVFLDVYSRKVSPWSQLYFIVFWILSVIVSVNLFTAIILENFIMRWDRHQLRLRALKDRSTSFTSTYSTTNPLSVHEMFRPDVEEPSEDELLAELQNNEYIYFQNL